VQAAVAALKVMCTPTDEGGQHMGIRADFNSRTAAYHEMTRLEQLPI
jgi:hypothetical protein